MIQYIQYNSFEHTLETTYHETEGGGGGRAGTVKLFS